MFKIKNFTDNDDIKIINELGPFRVLEYQRDLSVMPSDAMLAYYCNEMNVRKRQVICDVSKSNITTQAGAMQWSVGDVNATTGLKGVGDFFGKALRGSVTGESAIKPEYTGSGILVLEPTYKHILLIDTAGRLHNKIGLMNELTKIRNVMAKVIPNAPHEVMLVLDGSTGQNAFEQARQFTQATQVTSLTITKLDGTAKGGVVIGISDQFHIPVRYIGIGEGIDQLKMFDRRQFVDALFGEQK